MVPGTQRTWEKEEAKGKNRFFSYQLHPPGAGAVSAPFGSSSGSMAAGPAGCHVHLPGAGVPGHRSCRKAAREGEGRRLCGPGSVGEGRDIEIQTGGGLLLSALLVLFKIEL